MSCEGWSDMTSPKGRTYTQMLSMALPLYLYYFLDIKKQPLVKIIYENSNKVKYNQKFIPCILFLGFKTWTVRSDTEREMMYNLGIEYYLKKWLSIKLAYMKISHPEFTSKVGTHYEALDWNGVYFIISANIGSGWNSKFSIENKPE
ncbi:unnamed protein product [marine sediment metagenome]|uniref:Uncharacterized protein n=1 Tax=marine sediment metagenome TaxID=412755 RepID=X1JED1_9ZZZZ